MTDQDKSTPAPAHAGLPDAPTSGAASRRSAVRQFFLLLKVIEVRLRFIVVLVAVGLLVGNWETIKNFWDRWTRPPTVAIRQLEAGQEFFCPMDPNVIRDTYEPNGDVPQCPICGMPLSVRTTGERQPLPPGVTGRVQLTPERIRLAGVETVSVEVRPVAQQTTTVGYVAFDESRLSRVVSRVSGYVEKLYVDRTYATVSEGDPLAEIYSPQLYVSVQEFLASHKSPASVGKEALRSNVATGSETRAERRSGVSTGTETRAGRGDGNPGPGSGAGVRPGVLSELAGVARERLRLLGVSDQEIDAIERSGTAGPRLVIRSPRSGYVIEKKIVVGSSVEPGMTLLEVADLSAVWIEADVFEKDIALLQPGQSIEATVEAVPNRTFHGRLALVYPRLEAATRTNRVRFELENPDLALRPGMFATVRISTPLESVEPYKTLAATGQQFALASLDSAAAPSGFPIVPERSVIDTGQKKIVYVERGPGLFEGVEVELGPRVELQDESRTVDYYPVLGGLTPGDRVAAAGSFLIDAETRLNPAAASSYFGASGGPQTASRGSSSGSASSQAAPSQSVGANEEKPVEGEATAEDLANIAQLPEPDRRVARQQRICPVSDFFLGSMGVPCKITLSGQTVFLCCEGCEGAAKKSPQETLEKIARLKAGH